MMRAALSVVALLWSATAGSESLATPEEYRMAVSTASARGMALFVHDAATARASDELMRRGVFNRDDRLEGWLTDIEPAPSGVRVDFVGTDGGKLAVLHRVVVPVGDGELRYQALEPAVPLDESQLARWTARSKSIEALEKRTDLCSKRYNPVVLSPDPTPDGLIHVYLLAATEQAGLVVAGGHFRYDFSPDGKLLETQRSFTKACFNLGPLEKDKGTPVAFMLTHLLDPTPTEIHVFLSRLHGQKIYVMAEAGSWLVDGPKITFVERSDQK